MNQKELTELTDQELLDEAKKMKSSNITNAFFIGFFIAIVLYSVVKSRFGLVTLIPLYFAYKLFNKPNNKEAIEQLLKERNLK